MNTLQVALSNETVSELIINILRAFWLELLEVSDIDLDASFFLLGADSITVLKLLFRIQQQFGIRLLYKDIFENPTINLQARLIKCKNNSDYNDGEENEY